MRLLFVSDVHLSARWPDTAKRFLSMLSTEASGADALYILGDLFHVWLGDDMREPPADDVAAALKALSDSGVAVWFQEGNHDFLVREDYLRAAGMKRIPDEAPIDGGTRRLLAMHGDTLCTADTGYQQFRSWVRDPEEIARFLALPKDERQKFAAEIMRKSEEASRGVSQQDKMLIDESAATDALHRHGCDLLVHGHTHRPGRHELPGTGSGLRRFVLPAWLGDAPGGWGVWDGEEFSIVECD